MKSDPSCDEAALVLEMVEFVSIEFYILANNCSVLKIHSLAIHTVSNSPAFISEPGGLPLFYRKSSTET